ncbi:hypothetical protein TNCT_437901 [Trichonephila clavata]|uniref:Uncharacterized protein n=1 Tax=Trichonephila clavata TaxID=2740835 RepID=A0A8X6HCJ4_TRICU|nr:hypothetical protein TNCT_437901 [Trichonephila clavata]
MEPSPYIPEAERTRRILIERYMRLKHNYVYDSGCEKYPWLDDSAKVSAFSISRVYSYSSLTEINTILLQIGVLEN